MTTPPGEVRKNLAISLLLLSLILLCGDISSNPGPRYPCCVCSQQVSNSNKYSFQCNKSRRWVHEECSSGQTARDYNRSWICPSTVHNNNPVTVPEIAPDKLRVLQWNCNGIGNMWSELTHFLDTLNIHVAAIQESKVTSSEKLKFPGFSVLHKHRSGKQACGLLLVVKNSVNYTTLKNTEDRHLESQRIKLFLQNEEITPINSYIPPSSSCSSGYSSDFNALLSDKKTLLVGDLNSHHPSWHSGCSEDTRGTQLASALEDSQFIVLNSYGNTRAPPGGPESSPDVSAATSDISPCISWQIKKQLSSDHLPIVIDLQHKLQTVKTQKKSIMNLRKADWSKYADALESATAEMTTLDTMPMSAKLKKSSEAQSFLQLVPTSLVAVALQ